MKGFHRCALCAAALILLLSLQPGCSLKRVREADLPPDPHYDHEPQSSPAFYAPILPPPFDERYELEMFRLYRSEPLPPGYRPWGDELPPRKRTAVEKIDKGRKVVPQAPERDRDRSSRAERLRRRAKEGRERRDADGESRREKLKKRLREARGGG